MRSSAAGRYDEAPPPWEVSGARSPMDDPHWRDPAARAWLRDGFLAFYDQLDAGAQHDYWMRWGAPQAWWTMFLHPDLDALFAQADGEDEGHAPMARDFREEWLT